MGKLTNGCQEGEETLTAASAVPVLVSLLTSNQPRMQEEAAAMMVDPAIGSQDSKDALSAADVYLMLLDAQGLACSLFLASGLLVPVHCYVTCAVWGEV